jgi:hypothetical protein
MDQQVYSSTVVTSGYEPSHSPNPGLGLVERGPHEHDHYSERDHEFAYGARSKVGATALSAELLRGSG